MKFKTIIILISCIAFLFGCAHTSQVSNVQEPSPQQSNLTPGMVQSKIIKGSTTKNEILEIFGSPNIITKNKSGQEVWTYEKQSVVSTARSGSTEAYGTVGVAGVAGSRAESTQQVSTTTFTLMITFTKKDIVENYSMMSTKF